VGASLPVFCAMNGPCSRDRANKVIAVCASSKRKPSCRGMVGYVARWHRSNDISITTPTAFASNILSRRRANLDNRCVQQECSIIAIAFRILRAGPIAWQENEETQLLARNEKKGGAEVQNVSTVRSDCTIYGCA